MCAKVEPPGGGPEDKSPPIIISVTPDSGSVDVSLTPKIALLFSENMNKTATEKAIFISPLFFDYPEFSWSGKKLNIKLPERLKDNTTYVITVGAMATDKNGNKLGNSRSFPFSTGQTIYTSAIFGRVLDVGAKGMDVWAYEMNSDEPTEFWKDIPDYVTQTDSLGKFRFEYLSYGTYLVVAVDDKNNDQFWTPPAEKMALPDALIELNEDNETFGPLFMAPTERDTLTPYIVTVESPDVRKVVVEFSHRMDSASVLAKSNFKISSLEDTLSTFLVDDLYPFSDDNKTFILECSNLVTGEAYKLIARNVRSVDGIDADTISRIFEAGVVDTTAPELVKIIPKAGRKPLQTALNINLWFSEAIDTMNIGQKIYLSDTLYVNVASQIHWEFPNRLTIKPDLEPGETYLLTIVEQDISDFAGNVMGDSARTFKYNIAPEDTFGMVGGKVVVADGDEIVVVAIPSKGETISTVCDENGSFLFDRLFPDTYTVRAFGDANHDGKYSGGQIRPFIFAEHIVLYPDSVTVRSRWETDIGVIDFRPSSD